MYEKECLILNVVLLFIIIFVIASQDNTGDSYIRLGPGPSLTIMAFHIDTWRRWFLTVVALSLFEMIDAFISETAMNTVYNNIYNISIETITTFSSKTQLQTYAQLMYGINALRYILMIKISVTQIDFAIINILVSRLVAVKTIHMYIMNKKVYTELY
jgi:hypothetical protein